MCKIQGCSKASQYIAKDICQMHYFRFMRNGTYETVRAKARERYVCTGGYVLVYLPDHYLAGKSGYVYEHRKVMFSVYGKIIPPCEFCGAVSDWRSRNTHIDHIDNVRDNNARENLRVLCNGCNTRRGIRVECESKGNAKVTYLGETKTPEEWGRDSRVPVKGHLIRQRLRRGFSVKDAFFMRKKTHNKRARILTKRLDNE